MNDKPSVYLAIPYSFNPSFSHKIVNKVAAKLLQQGYWVYSPISHFHHVADHLPDQLRTDSLWWLQWCLPELETREEVWFVMIGEEGEELVRASTGCQAELKRARDLNKITRVVEVDGYGEILNIC